MKNIVQKCKEIKGIEEVPETPMFWIMKKILIH